MRFARFLALFVVTPWIFAGGAAVAQVPADLGRSEIRCDAAGCAVGGCVVRDLVNDPVRLVGTARALESLPPDTLTALLDLLGEADGPQ